MKAAGHVRSALRLVVSVTSVLALISAVRGAGSASASFRSGAAARPSDLTSLEAAQQQQQQQQQSRARRPFNHERHERVVSCRECHGSGSGHGEILIRTPLDCGACHHGASIRRTCDACHLSDSILVPDVVAAPMSLSVWDSARTRDLPFRHSLHVGAVACQECHRTETTLVRDRSCASCHASHHTPQANCSSCHTLPSAGVHSLTVHRSCAGSACHSTERALAPTYSRSLCLVCHPMQVSHEPGGTCADCHMIRERAATSARATLRSSMPDSRQ